MSPEYRLITNELKTLLGANLSDNYDVIVDKISCNVIKGWCSRFWEDETDQ